MIRLLLSLLALLSGLAVLGPAQARICGAPEIEIGTPAPARLATPATAQISAFALLQYEPAARVISALWLPAAQLVASPGVLIGIDRARQ